MGFAGRVSEIALSSTLAVKKAADELKRQGVDVIDFGPGEPDFSTPEHVKQAAYRAIERNFTKYTAETGIPELKSAIAQKYKREYGASLSTDEVIVTCGAKQALFNIAMALFEPGDEVILPSPYWVSYPEQIKLAGAVPIILDTEEEHGFAPKAEQVKAKITPKTKAIIINSPCNPSGAVIEKRELEEIIELARHHGFYVISDECYEHFVYEEKHASAAQFGKENVIVVSSVSKSYAMTGWRIGWAVGPEEIISAAAKIQSHSTSHPTSIAQAAAVEALNGDQQCIEHMLSEYRKRRNFIVRELNSLNGLSVLPPKGAFYVFPNVFRFFNTKIKGSADFARYLLEKAHIAVVPGDAFGKEGYIRISYAVTMEQLAEGLHRIRKLLQRMGRQAR